jgi:Tuberculosis necrotizing toxin
VHPIRLRTRTVLAAIGMTAGFLAPGAVASGAPRVGTLPAPGGTAGGRRAGPGGFHGDGRLGPRWLPRGDQRLAGLLHGYEPTGGLSPAAFLRKYWEGPADTGRWNHPPNDGFAEVNGRIDRHRTELRAGDVLDRFGSVHGGFLAPAGDPYARRALPPQSLNTADRAAPCNYYVYRVVRPFPVWQGSVAPWFEQPGRGRQTKLDAALLDPAPSGLITVKWLLDRGYLTAEAR